MQEDEFGLHWTSICVELGPLEQPCVMGPPALLSRVVDVAVSAAVVSRGPVDATAPAPEKDRNVNENVNAVER